MFEFFIITFLIIVGVLGTVDQAIENKKYPDEEKYRT